MQGLLLKLLVKDKLPHSREVPVNAKRLAAETPEERERLLLSLSSGVSAATLSVLSRVLLCCNSH